MRVMSHRCRDTDNHNLSPTGAEMQTTTISPPLGERYREGVPAVLESTPRPSCPRRSISNCRATTRKHVRPEPVEGPLTPSPVRGRGLEPAPLQNGGEGDAPPVQRHRQPQPLPRRCRDTDNNNLSPAGGEIQRGGSPSHSQAAPRPRARAGASVTAVQPQGNTFGLSLSKALLPPLPFAGEGWGEGDAPPGQRHRQPQPLPHRCRDTDNHNLSPAGGEIQRGGSRSYLKAASPPAPEPYKWKQLPSIPTPFSPLCDLCALCGESLCALRDLCGESPSTANEREPRPRAPRP